MTSVLLLLAACLLSACDKKDEGDQPIDGVAWATKNKPVVDAFRAKLDAAANLIKDLPAISVHNADPDPPAILMTGVFGEDNENTVILGGEAIRALPEYGRDDGKAVDSGDRTISVGYTGYLPNLTDAFLMVDTGKPQFASMKNYEGTKVAKRIPVVRYVFIVREVRYDRGALDVAAKAFTSGTYEAVAHFVDLEGPKHLGSVHFSAANTGAFESYSGSEKFMLQMDIAHEAIRAFHAEATKTFPKLALKTPFEETTPK